MTEPGGAPDRYRPDRHGAADRPPWPHGGLPAAGLRRVLALWGVAAIPFFRASRDPLVPDEEWGPAHKPTGDEPWPGEARDASPEGDGA